MTDDAPPPPVNYPLPPGALRPAWRDGRSRLLAGASVGGCLLALAWRTPFGLPDIDDVALRIVLPAGLAVVLAFAPMPGTAVGRIARDLTVVALCIGMFAGDFAPAMLAGYPLLLMASVLLARASETRLGRGANR